MIQRSNLACWCDWSGIQTQPSPVGQIRASAMLSRASSGRTSTTIVTLGTANVFNGGPEWGTVTVGHDFDDSELGGGRRFRTGRSAIGGDWRRQGNPSSFCNAGPLWRRRRHYRRRERCRLVALEGGVGAHGGDRWQGERGLCEREGDERRGGVGWESG